MIIPEEAKMIIPFQEAVQAAAEDAAAMHKLTTALPAEYRR
jgi:hypothetical protein